jgi:glycine cleavage system regulatory protein
MAVREALARRIASVRCNVVRSFMANGTPR